MGWSEKQTGKESDGKKIVDIYQEESALNEDDNYFNSALLF